MNTFEVIYKKDGTYEIKPQPLIATKSFADFMDPIETEKLRKAEEEREKKLVELEPQSKLHMIKQITDYDCETKDILDTLKLFNHLFQQTLEQLKEDYLYIYIETDHFKLKYEKLSITFIHEYAGSVLDMITKGNWIDNQNNQHKFQLADELDLVQLSQIYTLKNRNYYLYQVMNKLTLFQLSENATEDDLNQWKKEFFYYQNNNWMYPMPILDK